MLEIKNTDIYYGQIFFPKEGKIIRILDCSIKIESVKNNTASVSFSKNKLKWENITQVNLSWIIENYVKAPYNPTRKNRLEDII